VEYECKRSGLTGAGGEGLWRGIKLTLMTADIMEKTQKVDNPPRYNHFLPNKSANRPAKRSPLLISITLKTRPYDQTL
jgi:hypothetical protein